MQTILRLIIFNSDYAHSDLNASIFELILVLMCFTLQIYLQELKKSIVFCDVSRIEGANINALKKTFW